MDRTGFQHTQAPADIATGYCRLHGPPPVLIVRPGRLAAQCRTAL